MPGCSGHNCGYPPNPGSGMSASMASVTVRTGRGPKRTYSASTTLNNISWKRCGTPRIYETEKK